MRKTEIEKVLGSDVSKSKKMVELYNLGLEIKEIAELMGTRYNFVYNVVSNYCRMNEVELRTNQNSGDSKKAQIIALLKQGKTKTEIAKELKSNYNYIFKIEKEYKAAQ